MSMVSGPSGLMMELLGQNEHTVSAPCAQRVGTR